MPSTADDYSIWLVPDRETTAHQQLNELISDYAQSYADAPKFEPHITVVGGFSGDRSTLVDSTRALARERTPFDVSFPKIHCSTTKYQCVFLLVEPTVELLSLHQAASQAVEATDGMYMPHLSLIYSEMSVDQRLEIVESIDTASLPETAHLNTLALVETTGSVPEWETVTTYQL